MNVRQTVRLAEIEQIRCLFANRQNVLELGGGDGYQASVISAWGVKVQSIDVTPNNEFFKVSSYDGVHIPAQDRSVDLIFSSNVLEHVPVDNLPALLEEIRRVLKSDGISIHILPTPNWRILSFIGHYLFVLKKIKGRLTRTIPESAFGCDNVMAPRSAWSKTLKWSVFGSLSPHGEYPSIFSELYYFSSWRWASVFKAAGFEILSVAGNKLLYSGYFTLPRLDMIWRRRLALLFGSACNIFVLR